MFASGNQITRDDVKRVMNSGSLKPLMGGAMNNTGNDEIHMYNGIESRREGGRENLG